MTENTGSRCGITTTADGCENCVVVYPYLDSWRPSLRDPEAQLAEGVGLALAIGLDVVHAAIVRVSNPRPATLFGIGTLERLGQTVAIGAGNGETVSVVVVDTTLTPVQQRNLERVWQCKVIDRTGLILEIFGARARTRDGRLQVELAALSYQRSRLVRTWTHLERQRGGAGFMGGPGETQIETDRRLIDQRITRLKRELKEVKRTRRLHRQARKHDSYPIIALVGYTNAGKSTLFNRLTGATVKAKDQLFATLDPTMRRLDLQSGRMAILSDTVGFISDLPHELISAFHATLEEVIEADVIVHVRDIAHADTEAQKTDVISVLGKLGLSDDIENSMIEVLNKIDLLDDAEHDELRNRFMRGDLPTFPISAATGEGCELLTYAIDECVVSDLQLIDVTLNHGDGATLAWLYDHGEIIERRNDNDAVRLKVRLDNANIARFQARDV